VFIVDSGQVCKQVKILSTFLTFLMTHCSLQLCLRQFCNQTRCFIYRSGEALNGECSNIEGKAVYINIICSIFKQFSLILLIKWLGRLYIRRTFINTSGSNVIQKKRTLS